MARRNISVNGIIFPCPDGATVDQAKNEIRSRFLLAGGGLEDDNGALIDGTVLIRDTVGGLAFVGGQSIQQGTFLPRCTFGVWVA